MAGYANLDEMLADIRAELSVDGKEPTDLEVYEETGKRLLAVENRLRAMMDLAPISDASELAGELPACWRLQRRQKKRRRKSKSKKQQKHSRALLLRSRIRQKKTAAQIPRFRDRKSRIRHRDQKKKQRAHRRQRLRKQKQKQRRQCSPNQKAQMRRKHRNDSGAVQTDYCRGQQGL